MSCAWKYVKKLNKKMRLRGGRWQNWASARKNSAKQIMHRYSKHIRERCHISYASRRASKIGRSAKWILYVLLKRSSIFMLQIKSNTNQAHKKLDNLKNATQVVLFDPLHVGSHLWDRLTNARSESKGQSIKRQINLTVWHLMPAFPGACQVKQCKHSVTEDPR